MWEEGYLGNPEVLVFRSLYTGYFYSSINCKTVTKVEVTSQEDEVAQSDMVSIVNVATVTCCLYVMLD